MLHFGSRTCGPVPRPLPVALPGSRGFTPAGAFFLVVSYGHSKFRTAFDASARQQLSRSTALGRDPGTTPGNVQRGCQASAEQWTAGVGPPGLEHQGFGDYSASRLAPCPTFHLGMGVRGSVGGERDRRRGALGYVKSTLRDSKGRSPPWVSVGTIRLFGTLRILGYGWAAGLSSQGSGKG